MVPRNINKHMLYTQNPVYFIIFTKRIRWVLIHVGLPPRIAAAAMCKVCFLTREPDTVLGSTWILDFKNRKPYAGALYATATRIKNDKCDCTSHTRTVTRFPFDDPNYVWADTSLICMICMICMTHCCSSKIREDMFMICMICRQ